MRSELLETRIDRSLWCFRESHNFCITHIYWYVAPQHAHLGPVTLVARWTASYSNERTYSRNRNCFPIANIPIWQSACALLQAPKCPASWQIRSASWLGHRCCCCVSGGPGSCREAPGGGERIYLGARENPVLQSGVSGQFSPSRILSSEHSQSIKQHPNRKRLSKHSQSAVRHPASLRLLAGGQSSAEPSHDVSRYSGFRV